MSRWIPDLCLLGGIGLVVGGWLLYRFACDYIERHVRKALGEPFAQSSHCKVRDAA
jgi:hypothetical protein